MEDKKPDNVVFSKTEGYNAHLLPYATSVGAPAIRIDDLVSWKSRGITAVNKEFEAKFNDLKLQYESLLQEFSNFLSLIGPDEWNREHIGTFKMNSDKKWLHLY